MDNQMMMLILGEDPFDSGYNAFQSGLSYRSNPFEDETTEYWEWDSGWYCAKDEHQLLGGPS